jgi:hypothetical protein
MKMMTRTAVAAALVLTVPACNQQENNDAPSATGASTAAALNGTWKADLASVAFEGRPDEYLLQGETYNCNTCIPPLSVAADGQYHAVADRPYYDSMMVKVLDDRTVEMRRRKGDQEVSSSTIQVSDDGTTLSVKFNDATTPNAPPVQGTSTARRVGAAPAGAHAISGQWNPDRVQDYSEDALNVTYRVEGNRVTMNSQGQSYTAEIGGPAVPIQGDTGGTTVAVTGEGANGLRETLTRDGQQVGIMTIVPDPDGRSSTFTSTDPRNGSKTTWVGNKTG